MHHLVGLGACDFVNEDLVGRGEFYGEALAAVDGEIDDVGFLIALGEEGVNACLPLAVSLEDGNSFQMFLLVHNRAVEGYQLVLVMVADVIGAGVVLGQLEPDFVLLSVCRGCQEGDQQEGGEDFLHCFICFLLEVPVELWLLVCLIFR